MLPSNFLNGNSLFAFHLISVFRSLHSSILFLCCCRFSFLFLPSFVTKLSNAFDNVVFVLVVVVVGMFKV